jgi:predicted metal-binding membrane protein
MTSASRSLTEALLRRDRLIVIVGLVVVTAAAWTYVLAGAGMGMSAAEMTSMEAGSRLWGLGRVTATVIAPTEPQPWSFGYAVLMVTMWWVMMIAMMLPSASPMILLFAAINSQQREQRSPFVPTGVFALGYLLAWLGFSIAATGLQWGLEQLTLMSPMMASASRPFSGAVLIAAGVYQLTPLKHACLRHCRSPVEFLTTHWRKGVSGALRIGLKHGAFCAGCCWVLMGLLFVGGVMNLFWIGGIALLVLIEKMAPAGNWVGSIAGIVFTLWGGAVIVLPLLPAA